MRCCLNPVFLGCLVCAGFAYGDDAASARGRRRPRPRRGGSGRRRHRPSGSPPKTEEAKLLAAVREALERNAREIKALKDQYAKDMEEQRKKVEAQQKQIETLQQSARLLEDRLKAAQAAIAGCPRGSERPAPEAQNPQGPDRQQRLTDIQQKQLRLLEEQLGLVADEVEKQGPAVEKLQAQAATLESRSKQAAQRDRQLADAVDGPARWPRQPATQPALAAGPLEGVVPAQRDQRDPDLHLEHRLDALRPLPEPARCRAVPVRGVHPLLPGAAQQANAALGGDVVQPGGVGLGQAQIDMFINNWLTADVGLLPRPDRVLERAARPAVDQQAARYSRWSMRQVIPDGLTVTGLQFRGAKYLFGSPLSWSTRSSPPTAWGSPAPGSRPTGPTWAGVVGTTGNVNNAMAYGGRLGYLAPDRGASTSASRTSSAHPTAWHSGAVYSIWQPYFNYHRGNWDFRFEYGNSYENTRTFHRNNIRREGMYAQFAYRNYASLHQHLQRLEYVFRFSDAFFHGIDQSKLDLTALLAADERARSTATSTPLGVNYYLYASSILKFAYEINSELHRNLHDNVFMMQFATNF